MARPAIANFEHLEDGSTRYTLNPMRGKPATKGEARVFIVYNVGYCYAYTNTTIFSRNLSRSYEGRPDPRRANAEERALTRSIRQARFWGFSSILVSYEESGIARPTAA